MSRSGYSDDIDDPLALGRWRAQVRNSIRGKRGQAFLRELAAAMDAMPEKVLIANELVDDNGDCCAIGVICKARGIDVAKIDYEEPAEVAVAVGVTDQMVREIAYLNDEIGDRFERVNEPKPPDGRWHSGFRWEHIEETPEERWLRMRRWVGKQIKT